MKERSGLMHAAKFGALGTFEAVTVCGEYVLITGRERTL